MTVKNAESFRRAIEDVRDCGFVIDLHEVEPGVFVGQETQGNDETAMQLAERLGGIVIPGKNNAGITWINGGGKGNPGPHGVLIPTSTYRNVRDARNIAWALKVDLTKRPYFTVGGIARAILGSIGEKQEYHPSCESLLDGIEYGYHTCKPGKYKATHPRYRPILGRDLFDENKEEENPEHEPAITLYDVKSYYFEQLRRMESFKLRVFRGHLRFDPWNKEERRRYDETIQIIENTKLLRNTLAGAMAGSLKPSLAFTSSPPKRPKWWGTASDEQKRRIDEEIAGWKPGMVRKTTIPGMPGPYRAAGLLIVRSGWEMCREEAITHGAVYGTTDSVALPGKCLPTVWRKHGFRVTIKSRGDSDICHRGSYRIGNHQTIPYGRGSRAPLEKDYGVQPPVTYYKQWL